MSDAEKKAPMHTFWVHLKNGSVVKLRGRTFTVEHRGGSVVSYKYTGVPTYWFRKPQRMPLFIDPNEIIAVEQKRGWFR